MLRTRQPTRVATHCTPQLTMSLQTQRRVGRRWDRSNRKRRAAWASASENRSVRARRVFERVDVKTTMHVQVELSSMRVVLARGNVVIAIRAKAQLRRS